MYLKEFKDLLIQNSIDILWDQWTKLGVWISSEKSFVSNSDPESAIAFSEYFTKYEGRLSKISASWSKNKNHNNYKYNERTGTYKKRDWRISCASFGRCTQRAG